LPGHHCRKPAGSKSKSEIWADVGLGLAYNATAGYSAKLAWWNHTLRMLEYLTKRI
jgi:hypothetical protein